MRRRLGGAAATAALVASIVVAGPPAHAAFPGANGRIVFDTVPVFWSGGGVSNLYSIRPDGSGLKQLTDVPEGTGAWHPNVSPDGHRVVFLYSTPDAPDQVWIMRADGSHEHPLVDDGWEARGASFTPSGRRVVYSRCGFYAGAFWTCKIVSVRLDGTDRRVLVGGTWHPSDPVTAAGGELAFISDKGGFDARIWLANANGSGQHLLPSLTSGVERLTWSPDGTQLAFTGNFHAGSIYTIGVSDTGPPLEKVLPGSLWPAYSPDGMRIVSKVDPGDGVGPLRITWTDGTHPTELVPADMGAGFSDWGVAS